MTIPELAGSGAHILVFPYPAQGHMISLLDFTQHLAARGLTITVLVTPKNLPLLTPLLSRHPSLVRPLVLDFPSYPLIPAGVENTKDLPAGAGVFRHMTHALGGLEEPLFEWWTNQESPPDAIVSDIFLGWTHRLATRLGVPRLVFSPSGAMALSVMYSLWRGLPKMPVDENDLISFPEMPNCPTYPWWQISPLYRSFVPGEPVSEFIRECFLGNIASWGLVVNTFTELEGVYMEYLRKDLGHDRVWAVGPLFPLEDGESGPNKRGGASAELAGEAMTWLDTCEDHSVVYVCFGSQAVLTNKQMEALALGLEKSSAKFIWCTKEVTDPNLVGYYGNVPLGFEDRTSKQGRVVRGWAPQVQILSHRAVGVFLTHCGWNSMLESVSAGVPMLTWPMAADQFVDATLLVEQLGVAARVCEGAAVVPDSDELARLFSESLSEGRPERIRAAELCQAALKSIKKGGSSYHDLDELARSLQCFKTRPGPAGRTGWTVTRDTFRAGLVRLPGRK